MVDVGVLHLNGFINTYITISDLLTQVVYESAFLIGGDIPLLYSVEWQDSKYHCRRYLPKIVGSGYFGRSRIKETNNNGVLEDDNGNKSFTIQIVPKLNNLSEFGK
jgi:hypothetical protein